MRKDLYASVTNKILAELETGCAPWVKPWSATAGRNQPANADTNRPYSGINIVLIWSAMSAHPDWIVPRFVTFNQAKKLGGSVRAEQHGTKVYFVKQMIAKPKDGDNDGDKPRTFSMLREYTVFNVAQCENLPARCLALEPPKVRNHSERDATIDDFIRLTGSDVRHGGDRACYAASEKHDFIMLPEFRDFKSADHYYATSFHEHGHWTGAKTRLDREFGKRFGDKAYAAEELVAELCAAFLCAEFSIDGDLRHAGYLKNWIELLKSDSKAFFTAASKAQQAADYMRAFALAEGADASNDDDMPLAA